MVRKVWRAIYERLYEFVIGVILKLRYKLQVDGISSLKLDGKKGNLFLSNHVAEIDPIILEYLLWPKCYLRPIAADYLFHDPVVRWFLNSVRAIPIPSFIPGKSKKETLEHINKLYDYVAAGLDQGESFLLYPSGRLSRNGKEEIANQHSAHVLLHRAKEYNVYLIRVSGLWGSAFSRYKQNSTPKLGRVCKKCFFFLLRRAFFFMPKRLVKVTISQFDSQTLKQFPKRQDLNSFLSTWFNQEEEILPVEVPYT
ncbi:lysophospholipid acyltransferase family protein [Chlamydia sp. 17-3921]|uniref:lysophospholipid acyltransferase family protein n=1 Tax=Chlamydia sp. 17-3921 TaxID=2675798 RepID=UPI00191B4DF6|nr:1-acyl-sn-glycerol-3-phosphate acyltransferase [Chlamydia sp. 17-3921]